MLARRAAGRRREVENAGRLGSWRMQGLRGAPWEGPRRCRFAEREGGRRDGQGETGEGALEKAALRSGAADGRAACGLGPAPGRGPRQRSERRVGRDAVAR
jgi:hypothetical protein